MAGEHNSVRFGASHSSEHGPHRAPPTTAGLPHTTLEFDVDQIPRWWTRSIGRQLVPQLVKHSPHVDVVTARCEGALPLRRGAPAEAPCEHHTVTNARIGREGTRHLIDAARQAGVRLSARRRAGQ